MTTKLLRPLHVLGGVIWALSAHSLAPVSAAPQWEYVGDAPVTEPTMLMPGAAAGPAWVYVPEGEALDQERVVQDSGDRPEPPPLEARPLPSLYNVRGVARGITVNGRPYPDVGLYVPNAFAQDQGFFMSTTLDWVNRTRPCEVPDDGDWTDCADGVAYFDFTPIRGRNASLGFQYAVQSLSGRNSGTDQFAGQSLGFRGAWNITPTTAVAFGGEHIVQFDSTTDLGRNFYLVLSQAVPLNRAQRPIMLVATAGIGSDFYGYGDNGFGSTNCLSGNNISSTNYPDGEDCWWGPIGSLSVSFGSRFSIGVESFGYGIGAGISARPFDDIPLTFSVYATDFLGNTPDYIQTWCTDDPCRTRYYGRVTLSF